PLPHSPPYPLCACAPLRRGRAAHLATGRQPFACERRRPGGRPVGDCAMSTGGRSVSTFTPRLVERGLRQAAAVMTDPAGGAPAAELAGGREADKAAAEALSWLGWLSPDDAGIVRARLEGASWKAVCWRFGISRPTADRRWRYGLGL